MAGKSLIGALRVTLGLDSAEFTEGVSRARQSVEDAKKDIVEFGDRMAGMGKALTVGVTLPLLAAAGAAVKGAQEQAAAMAQVEAAIASMGNVAGRTAKQLADQADTLEMNSLFEGDVILKQVTANLLTFGNVAGEVFDRAQQAAVDMATRLGSEPQAAAIMLGKALNDPIKGVTALTKAGVQLSDSQKAQIKSFVATGQAAKAQTIILDELEKQFGGAAKAAAETTPWRQAQVAINQTAEQLGAILLPMLPAISDAIIGVAQAIGNLSPGMQQLVVIGGLVAAAFGPVLVAFGSLTAALVTRVIPALGLLQVAFWRTIAVMTSAKAAAIALSAGLRLLLVATPVLAAIAALAGGIYYLTQRTGEATAAARAKELQSIRTAAAADTEADATAILAEAQGKERERTLLAMQASRARAAQSIQTAKAKLAEARASIALAEADSKQRMERAMASTRGAGGGTDPGMMELGRRGRVIDPVKAKIAEAEEKYAKAMGQLDGLDRAIEAATKPVALPPLNIVDLEKSSKRAGKAIGGISDAAQEAKQKAEELPALLDRLFPEDAEIRKFREEWQLLNEQQRAGKLKIEDYHRAWTALRREFIGFTDLMKQPVEIETVGGTESVETMLQKVLDSSEEKLGGVRKSAEDMRVRVIESFAQMVDGAMQQLDRFARGLKSGNIVDIIGGLLNALDKLGAIFTGGKGFNLGPFTFGKGGAGSVPAFASGGSMKLGGLAGVDRNLLSMNGEPLAKVSRSEVMTITPANDVGAMGRQRIDLFVHPSGEFDTRVAGTAARVVADAASGIATMGANQAIAQSQRMQQRALS